MQRRTFLKNTSAAGFLTLITPVGIFQTLRHSRASGLVGPVVLRAAYQKPLDEFL